jgi:hypothetical protein
VKMAKSLSELTKKSFAIIFASLLLSGCAASKGFLAGAAGGVPYIDEIRHDEVDPTSTHTILKIFGHQSIILWTSLGFWPVAAAYGSASAIYGAFQFLKVGNKHEKSDRSWPDMPRRQNSEGDYQDGYPAIK